MTTQELKQQIDKVLGNSIRCLLPSYWWKRLFGLTIDAIEQLPDKQYVDKAVSNVKVETDSAMSATSTNAVQNKVIKSYIDNSVSNRQEKLFSGTNIKTINGNSILGSGNLEIEADIEIDQEVTRYSGNPVSSDAVVNYINDVNEDLRNKHGLMFSYGQSGSIVSEAEPNTVYSIFGGGDIQILSFKKPVTYAAVCVYKFEFTGATSLSLPDDVLWENGIYPTIEPTMVYELVVTEVGDGLIAAKLTGYKKPFNRERYMTIEPLEDGLTASLSGADLEYCIDGGEWNPLSAGQETPPINMGQIISFRGENFMDKIGTFSISKRCNLTGKCNSLFRYAEGYYGYELFKNCTTIVEVADSFLSMKDGYYPVNRSMFEGCTSLVNAPALPATVLDNGCYSYMFAGCTSLVNAPALPATVLKKQCYEMMFENCANLENAPELPALELVEGCYWGMFYGCSKLSYIKVLCTTEPSFDYTDGWVSDVAPTGTFVKNSENPWNVPSGDEVYGYGVPTGWTVQNA